MPFVGRLTNEPADGAFINRTGDDWGSSAGPNVTSTFVQVSSDEWIVQHDLGRFPAIVTVNESGERIYGNELYLDENNVIVKFSKVVAGTMYLI
jgi:hypothetical protein